MSHKGKLRRLQRLFERQHRRLYVAALAITKNRAAAEDAVHDALLAVADVDTEPEDLQAYVFRIVRNKAFRSVKQAARFVDEPRQDSDAEHDFVSVEQCSPEKNTFATQVIRHLNDLDNNQQQVLIMKLFAGFTFSEIATITENSPNTVASWYRRGLTQLKEKIDGK